MSQDNDSIPFDDEPISLEGGDDPSRIESSAQPISIQPPQEEEPLTISEGTSTRSISHTGEIRGKASEGHRFSRPMQQSGKGATRCRIFRSKISVPAVEGLQEHINDWLDSDDIDVKDVGHLIGTMHGKIDEDNIIVMIWY
ncbi:MAG: hypothetical protein QGG25_19390 [Phycisphaerae bacterium]|jgi:hypothetical protein|nr:hypothetical protein [Phycisphaerae bacterium]